MLTSLVLLIHLAENPHAGPVPIRPALQAISWTECLEARSQRHYAPTLEMLAHSARALGERIQAVALRPVSQARDVCRKHWAGLDREAVDAALDILESIGWIRALEVKTRGRPRTDYQANPRLKS